MVTIDLKNGQKQYVLNMGVFKGMINCRPPYELHNFPTRIKKPVDRQNWNHMLNRVSSSNKLWSPEKSSGVCSIHFIDRVPTDENPYPTENLGYNSKRKVENPTNSSCNPRRRKKAKMSRQPTTSSAKYVDHNHSYFSASVGPTEHLVDVVPNE